MSMVKLNLCKNIVSWKQIKCLNESLYTESEENTIDKC